MKIYSTHDVFGISTEVLEPSYVNRGDLDAVIQRDLKRNIPQLRQNPKFVVVDDPEVVGHLIAE